MPHGVQQRRPGASAYRPNIVIVLGIVFGIYSILAAFITYHYFGFGPVPYILIISPLGFLTSFLSYMSSNAARTHGFKANYMGALQVVGDVQGRGILVVLYYTLFFIPGLAVSMFADRLKIKKKPHAWEDRRDEDVTIEGMREQW